MSTCCLPGCEEVGKFTCSRCKVAKYCCSDHQKQDWSIHRKNCKAHEFKNSDMTEKSEKRECRCMFCGEMLILSSEAEAIHHMEVCPALQEQLNGKEDVTIPGFIRNKLGQQ